MKNKHVTNARVNQHNDNKRIFPKYSLENTIGQKGDKFVQRPHSDFLWFFAEGGILAGLLYMSFFFFLLRKAFSLYLGKSDIVAQVIMN